MIVEVKSGSRLLTIDIIDTIYLIDSTLDLIRSDMILFAFFGVILQKASILNHLLFQGIHVSYDDCTRII